MIKNFSSYHKINKNSENKEYINKNSSKKIIDKKNNYSIQNKQKKRKQITKFKIQLNLINQKFYQGDSDFVINSSCDTI